MITTKTYCGLNYSQLDKVLTIMSQIEDKKDLTEQQQIAFDISVQCVTEVMNRMKDDKPITFEQI